MRPFALESMLCLGLGNRKTVAEYHKETLLLLEVKPDIDNNDALERHPGGMGNPSLERPVHQHQSVHNPRGGGVNYCSPPSSRFLVTSTNSDSETISHDVPSLEMVAWAPLHTRQQLQTLCESKHSLF